MRSVLTDHRLKMRSVGLRLDHLCRMAAGRRVLHLGCLDLPTTAASITQGEWLHARLAESASNITGTDLPPTPPTFLQGSFPGTYLSADVTDLSAMERAVDEATPDLVVLSEVIEHLANPGAALRVLAQVVPSTADVVITTPNAFGLRRFLHAAIRRHERTHPDHVLLLSPYTLTNLVETSGFDVDELSAYEVQARRAASAVDSVVRRVSPQCLPGLVLVARVRNDL